MIILFDVGDVIIKGNHNITYKILQDYGVPEDRANMFFECKEYNEFARGNITGKELYKVLIKKYLKTPLTYEQIVHAHDEHIYDVDNDVLDVIEKVSKYKLAFLTDTNEWQTRREKELVNLKKYSNIIFRSHEIHMLKIDEGAFPYVLKQLKTKPDEVILIDDSPEKLQKAKEYGLQTIQFENAEQLVSNLKNKKIYI